MKSKTPPKVRKLGRPRKGHEKIKPSDYETMERLWARGWSFLKIARKYGVSKTNIRDTFHRHIFPAVTSSPTRSLEAELIRITNLERTAWDRFVRDLPAESRKQVKEVLGNRNDGEAGAPKDLIEKVVTTIKRPGNVAWLDIVKWCIEQRCKLEGHYTARNHLKVELDEYRVAGESPDEVNQRMMKRLQDKVQERQEYENLLRGAGVFPANDN